MKTGKEEDFSSREVSVTNTELGLVRKYVLGYVLCLLNQWIVNHYIPLLRDHAYSSGCDIFFGMLLSRSGHGEKSKSS